MGRRSSSSAFPTARKRRGHRAPDRDRDEQRRPARAPGSRPACPTCGFRKIIRRVEHIPLAWFGQEPISGGCQRLAVEVCEVIGVRPGLSLDHAVVGSLLARSTGSGPRACRGAGDPLDPAGLPIVACKAGSYNLAPTGYEGLDRDHGSIRVAPGRRATSFSPPRFSGSHHGCFPLAAAGEGSRAVVRKLQNERRAPAGGGPSLCPVSLPPISCAASALECRPNPWPSFRVVKPWEKIRVRFSGGMPTPLSADDKADGFSPSGSIRRTSPPIWMEGRRRGRILALRMTLIRNLEHLMAVHPNGRPQDGTRGRPRCHAARGPAAFMRSCVPRTDRRGQGISTTPQSPLA